MQFSPKTSFPPLVKLFNHYCAKHHEWWNTSNAKDCPICVKERKKKNVLCKRSKK